MRSNNNNCGLKVLTELMPKNASLHYTDLMDTLEMAQSNKSGDNVSDNK